MDKLKQDKIIQEAIDSWKNNKNRFNYISLKDATTVSEYVDGKDKNGNYIYIKNNLDKKVIHFGFPSTFNDKREFEFVCPEYEWIGFLIQSDADIEKFKSQYEKTADFDKALTIFDLKKINEIQKRREQLKTLGKYCADKYKDNYAVYCLAPSSHNSYFWENYCNNYNGICCEYDVDKICENKNIIRSKVAYSDYGVAYLPDYVNVLNFPELSKIKFNKELSGRLGKKVKESHNAILHLMTTKPEEWLPELETRLIMMLKDHSGNVINSQDVSAFPVKIYIGYKVSDELKEYFKSYCETNNIAFEIVCEDDCVDFKKVISSLFEL